MNVSTWAIRNPVPSILLFILLSVVGTRSFLRLKVQNFPDIDLPTINVSATLPGATSAQLETEVARKLEDTVTSLRGTRHVFTRIQDGSVISTVQFQLETPIQEAVDDVREAVSRLRPDLPADLRNIMVSKLNIAEVPMLIYTVSGSQLDEADLSWFVDNTLIKALRSVRGVGQVTRVGGVTRQVDINLDPDHLLALGATAADISRQLRQVQQNDAGGQVTLGGTEQAVRTLATVRSASELGALELALPNGRRVRLDHLARIEDTIAERRSAALLNGRPVVAIEIARARGASEVEVAASVGARIGELLSDHPDLELTEAVNFSRAVQDNFAGSLHLLYEGALLTVLVVGLFLRNWQATLISAAALPLSIVPTFAFLYLCGFSLNAVTLLALALVVGMLVDDAIVEIENIMRHLRRGKPPRLAAIEAAEEIGLAVIATTFTLVAVFLPTAFMGGVTGRFFVQFGWTAAITVLFSLLVARFLTPVLAAYLLRPLPPSNDTSRVLRGYMALVDVCLRYRATTILAGTLGIVASLALAWRLPTGFVPPDELPRTQVTIELPPGSTFEQTRTAAEIARRLIAHQQHIATIYTTIGAGSIGADPFEPTPAAQSRKASLTLALTPAAKRPGLTKEDIEQQLRTDLQQLAGARVRVGFSGRGETYAIAISSEDGAVLSATAARIAQELRSLPGLGNITSNASLTTPELIVRPDFSRLADLGVTSAAIAETLRIATQGDFTENLAKLDTSQRQIPILVKLQDNARQDLQLLSRLTLPGTRGPVPLGNVATLALEDGAAQIDRYDRIRTVTFEIELNRLPLGAVESQVLALPGVRNLPSGVTLTSVGDAEAMAELFDGFGSALIGGAFCIYLVLVLLFKDFALPLTILVAPVLAIPGAVLALFLTWTPLSMPSIIGFITLLGIVTKNAILLVDYVMKAGTDPGLTMREALLDACHKRARPILMTTVAMGAGMLPVALGYGADTSFRVPMAVVVIGGLITSTVLSLLIIPVVVSLVDDAGRTINQFVSRIRQKRGQRVASSSNGYFLPNETTVRRARHDV